MERLQPGGVVGSLQLSTACLVLDVGSWFRSQQWDEGPTPRLAPMRRRSNAEPYDQCPTSRSETRGRSFGTMRGRQESLGSEEGDRHEESTDMVGRADRGRGLRRMRVDGGYDVPR